VIRGYFEPADEDRQLARVDVRVTVAGVPGAAALVTADVPFVIDTGSETTCLHPGDAAAGFGISSGQLSAAAGWRAQAIRLGVGGPTRYFLIPCQLAFRHADGRLQELESVLEIAKATDLNQRIPSVLGWDVLQHFAMRFDWSKRLVELT